MKRIIATVLVIGIITGIYGVTLADEILFRGLPWGSSIVDFKKAINSSFSGSSNSEVSLISWEAYKNYSDRLIIDLSSANKLATGWSYAEYHFEDNSPIIVAGYNVMSIAGYFMYGTNGDKLLKDASSSKLYFAEYSFNVLDVDGAFDDLQQKLISLYGKGETYYSEGKAYDAETWKQIKYPIVQYVIKGDNGTELFLEKATYKGEGVYLMLSYGIEGKEEDLERLELMVYQEKLEEERNNRNNDTTGL